MTARQVRGRWQIADRTVPSATLPTNARRNPVRPCVEMMIKSARSFATASWIAVGQYPATADVWTGHLFTTSPARCFGVSARIVIPSGCRHHHRAEISHVKHDNARANLLCEPDRKFYTRQGTIREVHWNQNRTNKSLACTGART